MATGDARLGIAGSQGFIAATGILVVIGGVGLGGIRYFGGAPPEQGFEGLLGALALGAVVGAPGLLAILSLRDRPALLLPAAIILVPLSFISFALVTLPLLIPAGMLLAGYMRRSAGGQRARGTAAGTALVVLVELVLAFVVLFLHQDARSWTTATGGGSTSDVITYAESLACFGMVALAAATGWVLAEPRRAG